MANANDIRNLIDELGANLTPFKLNKVIEELKDVGTFNHNAALADLTGVRQPQPFDIIEAVRRHSEHRQYCGLCRDGWIPVLDWHTWAEAGQPDLGMRRVALPKIDCPCPTCQPHRKPSLADRLHKYTSDEYGWAFVILYEFYVYNLGKTATIEGFDPAQIWNLPALPEPQLTSSMLNFMAWVDETARGRDKEAQYHHKQSFK